MGVGRFCNFPLLIKDKFKMRLCIPTEKYCLTWGIKLEALELVQI